MRSHGEGGSLLTTKSLYGLVLAGGDSRRMGVDKAHLPYKGTPQLLRAYELLTPLVDRCFISVRSSQRNDAVRGPLPQVIDRLENCGPAAGLIAAMEDCPQVGWLAVACDLPLLDTPTLQTLISARQAGCEAVAYIGSDGKPEPVCAIWETTCLPELTRCVLTGNGSLRKALMNLSVHLLDPPHPQALFNANTPQEASRVGLP